MISLATTNITKEVFDNVNSALKEGRIGQGRFNKQFEEDVCKLLEVKHAICVNNGTMADMVVMSALKVKRPEKTEVIVPALTFVAQTNSILIAGLKPIFVDVKYDYQIDIDKVEEKITDKTLAIFAVHLLGHDC